MRMTARCFVVALSLIFAPLQAFGECAWVLWWHDITPVEVWEVSEAHPSVAECSRVLAEMADTLRRGGYTVPGVVPGMRTITFGKENENKRGYLVCLPDTVDPRGPKR